MSKNPRVEKPVYKEYKPHAQAKYIYIYYLSAAHKTPVMAYVFERDQSISWADMGAEVKRLVNEVIKHGDPKPVPAGWGLGDLRWRFTNYFAVVMDDADEGLRMDDAIEFNHVSGDSTTYNKAFRDGNDIPRDGSLTGFYCINHMRRHDGSRDLGDREAQRVYVEVNHTRRVGLNHNDSGTNMGPPIGP